MYVYIKKIHDFNIFGNNALNLFWEYIQEHFFGNKFRPHNASDLYDISHMSMKYSRKTIYIYL